MFAMQHMKLQHVSLPHLSCEKGEDAAARPDIHDCLPLEVYPILHNRCIVGARTHIVLHGSGTFCALPEPAANWSICFGSVSGVSCRGIPAAYFAGVEAVHSSKSIALSCSCLFSCQTRSASTMECQKGENFLDILASSQHKQDAGCSPGTEGPTKYYIDMRRSYSNG